MRFHEILSERTAADTTFALAPGLDPKNYEITGSMGDIEKWKAMTYVGEGRIKQGTMGPVGYIWISLTDNTIIPISRGDEHHEGADMLRTLVTKKKLSIPLGQYRPFYGLGTNYFYYREDVPKWIVIIQKFLAWGGKDGVMKGANSERGLMLTYSEFAASNGIQANEAGTLAPMGRKLYDQYKAVQDAIIAARGNENRAAQIKPFQMTAALFKAIALLSYHLPGGPGLDTMKAQTKRLKEVTRDRDLEALTELVFGFESIKRKIHEEIRHVTPKSWDYDGMVAFWGDVAYAENLLAHL